jgi:hypothetical protein
MRAERNHYLVRIPLAAPSSVHGVGLAVFVVCADNQHRLRKNPRIRLETFHILLAFKYGFQLSKNTKKVVEAQPFL